MYKRGEFKNKLKDVANTYLMSPLWIVRTINYCHIVEHMQVTNPVLDLLVVFKLLNLNFTYLVIF